MTMRRTWVLWGLAVVAGCLLVSAVVVALLQRRPVQITVSPADQRFFTGVYAVENGHRWTGSAFQLRVPVVQDDARILVVALQNGYPDTLAAPTVTARVGTHGSAVWQVHGDRVYALLSTPQHRWRWDRTLDVTSTVERIGADGRALGVVLGGVTSLPTTLRGAFSARYALGLVALLAIVVFVFAGLCAATPRRAAGISALSVVGLWGVMWWAPVATWPFVWWFVAGAWIALGVVTLAWLLRTVRHPGQPLRIVGVDLPLWCALAWWAVPFVQQVLIADNVYIRVYDYESWMGWVGAVGLAAAVLLRLVRRSDAQYQRLVAWLPLLVLAGLSVAYQSTIAERVFRYGSGDFSIWVDAATRWVTTKQLYLVSNVADNPFAGYKRPPFYIMLFTPFVGMETQQILNNFRVINIGLVLVTAIVWLRTIRPARWLWWVAVLLITICFQPLYETITYGQTDVILLCCMMIVLWAALRGRDGWAGVMIALLTSLKIYPVLLLVFFVIKKRWWAVIGFVAGLALWNGIAVVVMGWDLHWLYLTKVVGHVGGTTAWIENQTIAGFITRFYDTPLVMSRFADARIARIASLISYGISALVCLFAFKDTPAQGTRTALQYSLFVVLMVLAIPVAWMHYYTLMLLVFWVVLWHHQDQTLSLRRAGAYALCYAFIAYGNYKSFNYPDNYGAVTLLLGSYKLYAILLLYVLIITDVLKEQTTWAAGWLALWQRLRTRVRKAGALPPTT